MKKGRTKDADRILRRMAKINGKLYPDSLAQDDQSKEKEVAGEEGVESESQGVVRDFLRMFTYRVLLVRNLVLFLNW